MDFMAEFTEGMSRDRARQIIKRKRTKRQRNSSPFSMNNDQYCSIDSFMPEQSYFSGGDEDEDEDVANCLIMLAQSDSPVKEEKSDRIRTETEKLSSRRLSGITETYELNRLNNDEIIGVNFYECKTCNRTFPSFQALGGHRASHKRPKVNVEEKKLTTSSVNYTVSSVNYTPPPLTECVDEDNDRVNVAVEDEDEENKANGFVVNHNLNTKTYSAKNKVHECSICGSEFYSGQALGGHMRKHRPIPPPINRTVNSDEIHQITEKSPVRDGNMLSLDLNLPPPELAVEEQRSMLKQFTASSSSHQVFSPPPAFVDCHY